MLGMVLLCRSASANGRADRFAGVQRLRRSPRFPMRAQAFATSVIIRIAFRALLVQIETVPQELGCRD
jgi:hypothetical protein